jgi:hypothetical protein
MFRRSFLAFFLFATLYNVFVANKLEKKAKKQPYRNFGLLDKNLNTPDEYQKYRKSRIDLKAKQDWAEREKEEQRNDIVRQYLLPRVSGSILKDFFSRF